MGRPDVTIPPLAGPIDRREFALLFQPANALWPNNVKVEYCFDATDPDPALLSNICAVCFAGEDVVLLETAEYGWASMPGGTREPDEDLMVTLHRELKEEIGARVLRFTPFGRIDIELIDAMPYRPHLPFPRFQRLVGWADVELTTEPSRVSGGETVLGVHVMPVASAVRRIEVECSRWDAMFIEASAQLRARGDD